MKKESTLFDLPLRDLLIKINPKAIDGVVLMPAHWSLYEKLLDLADDQHLVTGSQAPSGLTDLYDDLFEQKILEQAPISYDAWKERLAASATSEEAEDIQAGDTATDSGTEIDLDFLDE